MKRVFISYSHSDKKFMRRLRTSLVAAGFDVWTDEKLQPGTSSWLMTIQESLEMSDNVIAMLSPHAKKSRWVNDELFYATLQKVSIIPVLAFGTPETSLPLLLCSAQYIDMRSEADWASGIQLIVHTLLSKVEKQFVTKPDRKDLSEYISRGKEITSLLLVMMEEFNTQTRLLGDRAKNLTPDFLYAKTNGDNKRVGEILKAISEYIMDYSDAIEKHLPSFQQLWVELLDKVSAMFSVMPIRTEKELLIYTNLRSSLETARHGYESSAIPGLQSFQSTLTSLEKQSTDLRRSVKIARPIAEELETSMRVGATYLGNLRDIADTTIVEYEKRIS